MQTSTLRFVRKQLRKIARNGRHDISGAVACEAMGCDDPRQFFADLFNCGCAGGMVGSLTYYVDTYSFFERHYCEIETLREEWEENTGQPLRIKGDLKNFLAWFAFEETAYRLAQELGLEI